MKYIIIENEFGLPLPIIFSNLLIHDTIAKAMSNYKLLSAGELTCVQVAVTCVSGSSSLGIKHDKDQDVIDLEIIIKNLWEQN